MKAETDFYTGNWAAIGPSSGNLYPAGILGAHGWEEVIALEDIAKGEECELVDGGFRRKRDEADTPTEKIDRLTVARMVEACDDYQGSAEQQAVYAQMRALQNARYYWPKLTVNALVDPAPYSAPNWTPVDTREPLPKKAPIKPLVPKKEPVMVEVEWKVTAAFSTVWLEGLVDGKFIGEESHTFWFSATPEKIAKILPKLKARLLANYRSYLRRKRAEASLGGKEQIQLDD